MSEHLDVIVVGAGLSGIGAGYHLQVMCPNKSYAILEGRANLGGTWDLFKYPGIRSDSDMFTFGYSFNPWKKPETLASAETILTYLRETAEKFGIDKHIRFNQHVDRASWSSDNRQWTLSTAGGKVLTCSFLFMCGGYYAYDQGYTPEFSGLDKFSGKIVHPMRWTQDIDCKGKNVVIIGSGATAITLLPVLAREAGRVAYLQRSPTYVLPIPSEDPSAKVLSKLGMPSSLISLAARSSRVFVQMAIATGCRVFPDTARKLITDVAAKELGSAVPVSPHFEPRYNPWDQRIGLCPDGDFFKALARDNVDIFTDKVDSFTEHGLLLQSGRTLQADVVVTATGMNLQHNYPMSDMEVTVDGNIYDAPDHVSYRNLMLSGVPNFAFTFGYTQLSWTLKSDMVQTYVCRLLNFMDQKGYDECRPHLPPDVQKEQHFNLNSNYIVRSKDRLPHAGSRSPWRLSGNYVLDRAIHHMGRVSAEMDFKPALRAKL
mmetsp:Transcript_124521/g.265472  ORF Transcript_124521/g.265472 Transcript_124521/m.265472 type:complete len:487 (-) Transcript_124521:17-1477(-)|eukprot:CAMPEP_0180555276 /NCGR_PEP_ID=MMETSP1036_2-20121128/75338_1 /TAXON_ID=632150 /ORGANISM="Azadinium spinosum, Strain 3D9" /LENGTH=486 /DNA_ID=CAMNT_0022571077 /DNA_START=51 /DNA_END=1511 /DNA_ORIENTATION=-